MRAYKVQDFYIYRLPIPSLLYVPFWVIGIVFAWYKALPVWMFIIPFIVIGAIKWGRIFNLKKYGNAALLITLSFMAGYFITKLNINLPENHISNLFFDRSITHETEYLSQNRKWRVDLVYKNDNRKPYIQQNVKGKVVSERHDAGDGYRYILQLMSFYDGHLDISTAVQGKITLFSDNGDLNYGDIINAGLYITENMVTNPGQRDFSMVNRQQGIYAHAREISPIIVIENQADWFKKQIFTIRAAIRDKINNNFLYARPLALAMILGDRQYLDEYGDDFYSHTLPYSGVLHLFAVSGLHVGLIALIFITIFRACRVPWILADIVTILLLIIYSFILNLSPPVVRAVIFFSFLILADKFERKINKWHLLLLTLVIVTFFNPLMLFSVSLQYSFLAFAGVIFYSDSAKKNKLNLFNRIINYFLLIMLIHLMLLTPMLNYFNVINLNAFVANAICIPLFTILFPLFFVILILPFRLSLFSYTAEFLTEIFNKFVEIFSNLPFVFNFSNESLRLILMQILIFIGLIMIVYQQNRLRFLQGMIICFVALCLLIQIRAEKGFQMIFFDTGNADAALIRFNSDDYMIIDTSEFENNSKNISKNMVNYLKKERISNINRVLLTHPHSDHYAGVFYLAEHVKIDTLTVSEYFTKSGIMQAILMDKNFENTFIQVLTDTLTYNRKDYKITFLHPDKDFRHHNPNNMSVVCKITFDDLEVLFTGDIEKDAEDYMMRKYPNLMKADILKIAHHGSNTGSDFEFLKAVNPEVAIISASGKRGFPAQKTLDNVNIFAERVYVTGWDGAVVVTAVSIR